MELGVLGYLAIIIFSGLLFGRLVKLIKLPNVTGYLIAGLVIGPCCLRLVPKDIVTQLELISKIALGFIAFSIGSEFKLSYLKKIGAAPLVIAVFEAVGAVLMVFLGLLLFGQDVAFSLVLAAIAAATAPAATIMVINQYKAKGPVTSTLLTVVAVDDAIALMAFGICVAISGMITGTSEAGFFISIAKPVAEIVGALGLGAVLGGLILIPLRYFKKPGNRLSIIAATIFLGVALADLFGLSSLLLCMMLGAVFVN
ncbi:MAG: cation:proton antiporter, partial [Clostridia bacterium]